MKRKGSRRSGKSEDENSIESDKEEPQEKKGRKTGRSKKVESDAENRQSDEESTENGSPGKKGRRSGKQSSPKKSYNDQQAETSDEESTKNGNPEKKGRKSSRQSSPKKTYKAAHAESSDEDDNVTLATKFKQNGTNEEKKSKISKKSKGGKKKEKKDAEPEAKSLEEADPLAANKENEDDDEDTEYEVESIIDKKVTKGVTHYLIRWKGYTEESDTWEPEDTLDCKELIDEFNKKEKTSEKLKTSSKKQDKKKTGRKKLDRKNDEQSKESWDENEDFEVDRIIDVYFHRNGKREFLVSWKGYPSTDNSWEPEDNMDCKDLIAKFMEKVNKARQFEGKESRLRVNPRQVDRLTFDMHQSERRLSKRHGRGVGRVHYFDAE